MTLERRIDVLVNLGVSLKKNDEALQAVVRQTYQHNPWFTTKNTYQAIYAIVDNFLQKDLLQNWINSYIIPENRQVKKVGLILAGNIPLVGFHDLLCVFVAGHKSLIKLSEKDKFLLPYFLKVMETLDPDTKKYFEIIDRLQAYDAVIATGSNNSARYFEAYFGKSPHIIRKNRNAVAVLTGKESHEQLMALGDDVFSYFGLGCRNVSKLYIPKDFDFKPLLEAIHTFKEIILHNKYKNNFDYGYTLLILNKIPYEANGCIMMIEEQTLQSRIATLHYEYYENDADLSAKLESKKEEIQCIVGNPDSNKDFIPFGEAQSPGLNQYADGVDTMSFLLENLNSVA